ncbi:hypothetical protein TSUD_381250 [Trifolium subterraneum]|uniref:Retrotransposon gag domain-containing protein n=1 Tax=Trifolium subterraneum TaxID=3900 RepID=A0A2Z6N483_TRISU|nr:hypothetical protein TSUD_381250 [Trifolium subterraneum]
MTPLRSKLAFGFNMKVVALSLSFPTHLPAPQSDIRSSSYGLHNQKVPDFEKYKGSTCPKAHLIMYARKMSTQTSNDKLLIHYFQDSLTGAALRWYMDLDRANVSYFNDLASAFIRQYNYNSYLAPDRDELRALAQKESESFKEYAQRWRKLTAQIRPPVEEKELCKLFLHTLSPFFYEKMVGVVSRSFTEMVEMGMNLPIRGKSLHPGAYPSRIQSQGFTYLGHLKWFPGAIQICQDSCYVSSSLSQ